MKTLFCVYGSAGDILPYMAVAESLRGEGADPQFLTDRWLSLYPRSAGFRSNVVGTSSEKRVLEDSDLFSTRFQGLDSRRRLFCRYVLPFLDDNYIAIRDQIRSIAPDLIVTSPLGLWGALVAAELDIPHVALHLYPDLLNLLDRTTRERDWRFALPLARWLEAFEDRIGYPSSSIPAVSWGSTGTPLLLTHDPVLVDQPPAGAKCVGFPYWDRVLGTTDEQTAEAQRFLSESQDPTLIVCLGSFIGLREPLFWREVSDYVNRIDARALLVGVPEDIRTEIQGPNVRVFGYLQMSKISPLADVVIHHGGIGTMYGVLQAGVPAIVVPRAFDQPFNASVLAKAGGGQQIESESAETICDAAIALARDSRAKMQAEQLSSLLVPPDLACSTIVAVMLNAGG